MPQDLNIEAQGVMCQKSHSIRLRGTGVSLLGPSLPCLWTDAESYSYADFSSKQALLETPPRSGDKLRAKSPELRCVSLIHAKEPPWAGSGTSSHESLKLGPRLRLGDWHSKVSIVPEGPRSDSSGYTVGSCLPGASVIVHTFAYF